MHAIDGEDNDYGSAEGKSQKANRDRVSVELSPWMVVVRAEGYHAVEVMLPYPVFSDASNAKDMGSGFAGGESAGGAMFDCFFNCGSRTLYIVLTVDTMALDFDPLPLEGSNIGEVVRMGPDPGSRPWLLSQAITDASRPEKERVLGDKELEELEKEAEEDDDVFPEDKFHSMDAMSQHYNMQKEQGRREREKKQREKEAQQAKEKEEADKKKKAEEAAARAAEELFAKEHPEEQG